MTREEIIKLAREADLIDFRDADDDPHTTQMVEFLDRFATLVAAKEREALQRKPLTDEQIFDLAGNYDCGMREENENWNFTSQRQMRTFVRAIEAAHGIKEQA